MSDILWIGLGGAGLAFFLGLLNARDRRRDRIVAAVMGACATPGLRGLVAVRVRAPFLSRRTAVVLDMSACGEDEIWQAMRRLSHVLPPNLAVIIDTPLDRTLPVIVTLRRSLQTQEAAR